METEKPFLLFSRKPNKPPPEPPKPLSQPPAPLAAAADSDSDSDLPADFSELGLSQWALDTCRALRMHRPTRVQACCIPRILAGRDVLGIAETGSGKTAAFALPILHRLAEDRYGVLALVLTPTRELACQLADQFRALGSSLDVRCSLAVGGLDMIAQARDLANRPHVVVATPGRISALLQQDPDLPRAFSKLKFLVLDEADRVLDVGFEDELRVILRCLPAKRQTLLFSATMTSELQALHESSTNKPYLYSEYKGFKTVDSLKQQFILVSDDAKDVYLVHILSQMEEEGIRSAIIFVSTCRTCHLLNLLLEELKLDAVSLHSYKSQPLRLSALNRFKSGKVSVLLATDVASRGLDIPTVDLVINYDIPRYSRDYIHRVGRTARAGKAGVSMCFATEKDEDLIRKIEEEIGKELEKVEYKEDKENITAVFKARCVARMKMLDDGFEEKVEARKAQKRRTLEEKGLLKPKNHKKQKF